MTIYTTPAAAAAPIELTPQEIKALLEAVRELSYYMPGQTSAADKLKAALK